mgnify:CR=1 FL=1
MAADRPFPAYGILQMGDDRNAGHRFSGCSVDRNKKINPSYKLAWTMLILIFPVFGVSLYLLFGKSRIGAVMEQHYQNLIDETAEYLEGSELTENV